LRNLCLFSWFSVYAYIAIQPTVSFKNGNSGEESVAHLQW
jgi:hypothetical protein